MISSPISIVDDNKDFKERTADENVVVVMHLSNYNYFAFIVIVIHMVQLSITENKTLDFCIIFFFFYGTVNQQSTNQPLFFARNS